MTRLYDFQQQALDAEARHRVEHPDETRLAIVLPTGTGKGTILAERAARFIDSFEGAGNRVLILVHTDELVNDLAARCALAVKDSEFPIVVGIVKAGQDDTDADIIVASVQTLANPERRARIHDVGLVIVDECFPAGTLVGGKPIESLKPGDMVPSWDERTGEIVSRPVVALMSKRPNRMVRVTLDDGQEFACTPNHPILTSSGWCPAGMLLDGECVVSFTHDTTAGQASMHMVRDDRGSFDPASVSLGSVPEDRPGLVSGLMPGRVGEPGIFAAYGQNESSARVGAHESEQPHGAPGDQGQDVGHTSGDRAQAESARGEWRRTDAASVGTRELSRVENRGSDCAEGWRTSVSLSGGYRASLDESGDRGGRGIPFLAGPPSLRPTERGTPRLSRVVDVQVLESGSDGTYGGVCPDGLVYNIEVADTHTYLVGDVVVHNCHHATADSYQAILRHFGCYGSANYIGQDWSKRIREEGLPNAFTPALGFTATLERTDGAGLGQVWQNVVFTRDISWAVRKGFLVQPVGYRLEIEPGAPGEQYGCAGRHHGHGTPDCPRELHHHHDEKCVRPTFAASTTELDAQLCDSIAPERIVEKWLELAKDRQTIVFAPLVRSARVISNYFADAGITVGVVYGDQPEWQRRQIVAEFKSGAITVLVNAMVLTEGFDHPGVSCVIVARPTKSRPLFIQMAGRGLRRQPGIPVEDQDCILITLADATSDICSVADLSDRLTDRKADGALTVMEDAFDIGKDLEDAARHWTGKVNASEFDPIVARSSKVWARTKGGHWFLPISDQREYVFLLDTSIYVLFNTPAGNRASTRLHADLPDLELAMQIAEDEATEHGGDLGAMLADRSRPWRNRVPSEKQQQHAMRLGLEPGQHRIMASKAGGKAGKLSDLIRRVEASRSIDRAVARINDRKATA